MITIRFGRWANQATDKYVYSRIYRRGWKWTPFCRRRLRYKDQERN